VEPKTLFLLALALGVSGLIAYKTFQWVIYEEISVGVASLFLGFAILVFFSITNYDIIKAWTTPGSYNARNSKEDHRVISKRPMPKRVTKTCWIRGLRNLRKNTAR
jgi:hypothetical protein